MKNKNNGKTQNRVAQLRKERGLSQQELSELLYVDQRTISNIENGICTLHNLVALADIFGVSLDYILKRSDDRGNSLAYLEEIDFKILEQLRELTEAEKGRLLKHLELDNSLKLGNGN